jgi:hypothetical protein
MFMYVLTSTDFQLGHLDFSLLKTADGSFSLRYKLAHTDSATWTEPMHSSKGAWSETLHVYFPALVESMTLSQTTEPWKVASIGLGLGYNEILSAALAFKSGLSSDQLRIYSFESELPLQSAFRAFFSGSDRTTVPVELKLAYDHITDLACSHLQVDKQELQTFIRRLLNSGSLELHGRMDSELLIRLDKNLYQSHCVLFDAFSPESSPLLWELDLLDAIVAQLCAPSSRFVSYASRTSLKRVLVSRGFQLSKKPGFAGKRECTCAARPEIKEKLKLKKD